MAPTLAARCKTGAREARVAAPLRPCEDRFRRMNRSK
jgi:hypothetical protein